MYTKSYATICAKYIQISVSVELELYGSITRIEFTVKHVHKTGNNTGNENIPHFIKLFYFKTLK